MAARSTRSPPAAADRVRRRDQDRALCHGRHQAATASPCASARRATPTTPTAQVIETTRRPARRCRDRGCPARPSAATSCRSRRSSRPSRSPASAPMTWRARAAPPVLEPRPARVDRFELVERPDADTAVFEVAVRQGRLHAQPGARPRPRLRHASAISRRCAGCGSARSLERRRFRWTNARTERIPRPLPRTFCFRSRPRWPTSRRWP